MAKRLIDANAADVDEISCYYGGQCYLEDVQQWLDEQPTVDAVEVVRCKDCKYWWRANEMCVHPKCVTGMVAVKEAPKDHFCGYGERNEK